jgi:hypothetical protein
MLFGVQIIILLFGLVMMYFTFLYYKRANYDKLGLAVWFIIWLGFIFLGVFPQTVYGVMQLLAIERTADVFYAGGMLFFAVLMFYLYNITKKNQKQVENIVRKLAIRETEKKSKATNK